MFSWVDWVHQGGGHSRDWGLPGSKTATAGVQDPGGLSSLNDFSFSFIS